MYMYIFKIFLKLFIEIQVYLTKITELKKIIGTPDLHLIPINPDYAVLYLSSKQFLCSVLAV